MRVGAKRSVADHQAQADTARNQAGAFTERDINLGQVAHQSTGLPSRIST